MDENYTEIRRETFTKMEVCRETFTKMEVCRETFTKMEVCRETFTETETLKETCNGYRATSGNKSTWVEPPNTETSLVDVVKTADSMGVRCSKASVNQVSDCPQNKVGGSRLIPVFITMCVVAVIIFAWNLFVPAAQMNIADGTNLIVNMRQFFDPTLVSAGGHLRPLLSDVSEE